MITADDLTQIADDICNSILADEEAAAALSSAPLVDEASAATLAAVVDISGDWNGSVSVSCERQTAVGIASAMFATPAPELSGSDITDALGELANMAGGAVKGMLDGEKSLGLPTVAEGEHLKIAVPNTAQVARIDYSLPHGAVVHVAVHQLHP